MNVIKFALLIPLTLAARMPGQPNLGDMGDRELQRMQSQNIPPPPNFNKVISVPGMDDGTVRFFTEYQNRKPEDPLIIYLHGGAYVNGMQTNQAQMLTSLYDQLGPKSRASIVWVDYTLSTSMPFPQQLLEATSVYSTLQKTSKNIILMGDSSGAHLAVALMRHINKPFDKVPAVPDPSNKPKAAVLISPWLQLSVDLPVAQGSSYDKYRNKDIVPVIGINLTGRLVLREDVWPGVGKLFGETYNDSSIPWAEVLPDHKKILVTAGETEVLRDSIETFFNVAGLKTGGATLFVEPNGVHDTPANLGPDRSAAMSAVNQFFQKMLGTSK